MAINFSSLFPIHYFNLLLHLRYDTLSFFTFFLWQTTFSSFNQVTMLLCKIMYLRKTGSHTWLIIPSGLMMLTSSNIFRTNFGYMYLQFSFLSYPSSTSCWENMIWTANESHFQSINARKNSKYYSLKFWS